MTMKQLHSLLCNHPDEQLALICHIASEQGVNVDIEGVEVSAERINAYLEYRNAPKMKWEALNV